MRPIRPASRFARIALLAALIFTALSPIAGSRWTATAAQPATATTNVNLRSAPNTSSAILAVVPAGATVEVTGALIGEWYPVTYGQTPGYIHGAYLSLAPPAVGDGATARVQVLLNLRAGPGTSFARLTTMPAGTIVVLTGESQNGFWRLSFNGALGWASSTYLTLVSNPTVPAPTNTPVIPVTPVPSPTITGTAVPPTGQARALVRLNLRSGAGTNFPVITIIPEGGTVDLLGQSLSGFQQVRYAGNQGWAYGSYLGPLNPPPAGTQRTALTTTNLNLRQGPNTVQAVIEVIPVGRRVILTGAIAGSFWQVTYNGVTGWAAGAYLSGTGEPPGSAPLEMPVLMYHRILGSPGLYQVTEQTLRNQMAWLAANGYESVTPADIAAWLDQGVPLPARPVMITIDDGNPSDVLFKRILDEYGFDGVWYLTNVPPAVYSADVIRAMDRDGQVCGHTVSHQALNTLSYAGQLAEIRNNKTWIEGILGHSIDCFAYPYGAYNGTTMGILNSVGYSNAVDAWGGPLKFTPELDRLHMTRINLSGFYTLSEFIGLVS